MRDTASRRLLHRPLIDDERSLLLALASRVLSDRTGCTHAQAGAVLATIAAAGGLVISGDAEDVYVEASGTLLVHTERDWLAFHASHKGFDPMRDEMRGAPVDRDELGGR
jgi:hypothetical protein